MVEPDYAVPADESGVEGGEVGRREGRRVDAWGQVAQGGELSGRVACGGHEVAELAGPEHVGRVRGEAGEDGGDEAGEHGGGRVGGRYEGAPVGVGGGAGRGGLGLGRVGGVAGCGLRRHVSRCRWW